MAALLDQLKIKVKKSLGDFKNNSYFNPESNKGQNFWSSKIGQGMVKAQQAVENPTAIKILPTISPIKRKGIAAEIGNSIANIPISMANSISQGITSPVLDVGQAIGRTIGGRQLEYEKLKAPGRIALQVAGKINPVTAQQQGTRYGFKQTAGNLAGVAEPILDAYIPKGVSNLAGAAGKGKLLHNAIKSGAVSGTKYGGIFGGISSLSENRNEQDNKKYTNQLLGSVVGGAGMGLALGGATGGVAGIIDNVIKAKYPKISENEVKVIRERYLQDTVTGKFRGSQKKQPVFYGDLNESLGLPRHPDNSIPLGLSVKKLTKGEHEVNVAQFTKEKGSMPKVELKLKVPQKQTDFLPSSEFQTQSQELSQTPQTLRKGISEPGQAFDDIIANAKKKIGGRSEDKPKSIGQSANEIYTQWVDRYNPITKATDIAKKELRIKGAQLRPEYDSTYQVRRLTGAGGIADYRFRTKLEPVIKELDSLGIAKDDMDVYLANKRIAGFGEVGRDVYGADPVQSKQVVGALETKYGENIKGIAQKLYEYQDNGFQEMVDAGFLSPETAKIIKGQNPDYAPLQRVMDEVDGYLGLPTRKTMQGSQPVLKLKGSKRQIESPLENIIANTFKQRAAIEKNNVAKSITGLQNVADLGFKKTAKSGTDTITIWNNGQKEYWQVGDEIANVVKGLNEENMNALLKIFTVPASILRQGATGRNPEFMIPNIVRDQLDAGITSKYGYIPFVDYLSGLKSMLTNDEIYQKWQSSGAKIDLGEMSGRKNISLYMNEKTGKKGLFKWISSGLDVMGKYSEQPTRVGLFKKAYNKTGNETLAMMESRDATVDFARMGSKMKVANSIVPFLNVGVQGFDKLIRSIKDHPGKVIFNASVYGALPAITTTLYNLAYHPEEYAEIPQYEKDSNFVLVSGRNENGTVDYVTIPKGNVLPVIANPIQSFLEFASGQSQQALGEFVIQFISSTLPVVGDGQSLKEVALKTVGSNLPQLVKPITENLVNKSFYKYDTKKEETKEIVPYYLKDKEAYKQSYKFTPAMYKGIGTVLNVSPLQVQNFMEGYLAGYSKIPAQLVEIAKNLSEGKDVETNQKTILRRFIKETYPTSGGKATEVKTEKTPLMERLSGVAKAADKDENLITYTKDGKEYELDLGKTFEIPDVKDGSAYNKEAISRVKSDITKQINDIYDAAVDGKITEEKARDEIEKLQKLYDQTKKGKGLSVGKATKIKGIQIKVPAKMPMVKFSRSSTPKLKLTSTQKRQTPKLKLKNLTIPKIKISSA